MPTERKPLVYRGAIEICSAIGVETGALSSYIRDLNLPVFKINGEGQWLALESDLEKWLGEQRDHFFVSITSQQS